MKVLKFGGSSLGDTGRIRKACEIINAAPAGSVTVVSAMHGMTDRLCRAGALAAAGNPGYEDELREIEGAHIKVARELTSPQKQSHIVAHIKALVNDLEGLLKGISVLHEITPKSKDYIVSYGEQFSALLVSCCVQDSQYVDARTVIRTDRQFGKANIHYESTEHLVQEAFSGQDKRYIVTGFISAADTGETTTLGRGGSDLSAAVIASALGAELLEIWTDVDGIMTADPTKVEKAYPISQLSYAEAMELSHFGAKVVYPPTVLPAYRKNIPVLVKNTFAPEKQGTYISHKKDSKSKQIKGLSSIEGISLMSLRGLGMVGVTGISQRLFGALASRDINIILISQASSEYSITFAIDQDDTDKARGAIKEEFAFEMHRGQISTIDIEKDMAIVAVVGENMKHTPGISGKLFHNLGANGINVAAIAQGASELNISFVIESRNLRRCLNAIHESFFLSPTRQLNLFICGMGTVGSRLLAQVMAQHSKLHKEHGLLVNITGMANSKRMFIMEKGIQAEDYLKSFETHSIKANARQFVEAIRTLNLRNSIFVDCTASSQVASLYHEILSSNISIVTANKIAASSEQKTYQKLKTTARQKNVKFYYETNVGAGLPIIGTLNNLVNSGDRIEKLEAVLSGTLNFIFDSLSANVPLSKAITMAREQGYSEPDPRIDLSGTDVIRKLVILARESGRQLEPAEVEAKPFLPEQAFQGEIEDFFSLVKSMDKDFEERRRKMASQNKCWRYIARFEGGRASVGLEEVSSDHPFFDLRGSNNMVMITTQRYHDMPMLIQGYGAGADVTAAGVFADIIRVGNL